MCRLAESSFQSLSSRFGSISGCRSKVFLSPPCGGVESSAEPIIEIPTLQWEITGKNLFLFSLNLDLSLNLSGVN
jgi:hypothetical protein